MWERGVRDSRLRERPAARGLLVGAVVILSAALVTLTVLQPAAVPTTDFRPQGAGPATATPVPDPWYTLDGTDPQQYPDDRTGLAFLSLDDPLGAAVHEFGPAQQHLPDINASTAHTWLLPGEAELTAVTADGAPGEPIVGLAALVPRGSHVRFGLHGGVVLGRSTPADVVERWGEGYHRSEEPGEDWVVRYVFCHEGWPVVVKFDQQARRSWEEDPVTRVLLAYADEDPEAAGCAPH